MTKHPAPITIFCRTICEAKILAGRDSDSRALTTVRGTLNFHKLIAQHGAGEFTTLYVPAALQGSFAPPVGGVVHQAMTVQS